MIEPLLNERRSGDFASAVQLIGTWQGFRLNVRLGKRRIAGEAQKDLHEVTLASTVWSTV
jgi:hypothetical protein